MAETDTTPLTAITPTPWQALLCEVRAKLDKESGEWWRDGRYTLVRRDTPRHARVLLSGVLGFLMTCLVIAGIGACALIPQDINIAAGAALMLACTSAGIGAACGLHKFVYVPFAQPHQHWVGQEGDYFLGAFARAQDEIRGAAARGVPAAVDADAVLEQMVPGLEELAIEYGRLSGTASNSGSVIRGSYRDALDRAAADVYDEMLEITTEVTATARVLFAQRDDLIVAVREADITPVDPATLRVRTDEAQQAMRTARAELARLAAQATDI